MDMDTKDDEWLESVVGLVAAAGWRNECGVSGQPLVKTTLVASSGDLPFTEPLLSDTQCQYQEAVL